VTARWVVDEVRPARDLRVTWQPISLFIKNEPPIDTPYGERTKFTHDLLRVMESVRAADGVTAVEANTAVERLYWELGRRQHHDRDPDGYTASDALASVGLDPLHAAAFDDASWDAEIRRRMDEGIALCGEDVGTPIIALTDRHGDKQGYFGPVITRVPPTEDALAMWDALVAMMNVQGFWELKRTRTERPDFGERP
jgi:hypothetical protein